MNTNTDNNFTIVQNKTNQKKIQKTQKKTPDVMHFILPTNDKAISKYFSFCKRNIDYLIVTSKIYQLKNQKIVSLRILDEIADLEIQANNLYHHHDDCGLWHYQPKRYGDLYLCTSSITHTHCHHGNECKNLHPLNYPQIKEVVPQVDGPKTIFQDVTFPEFPRETEEEFITRAHKNCMHQLKHTLKEKNFFLITKRSTIQKNIVKKFLLKCAINIREKLPSLSENWKKFQENSKTLKISWFQFNNKVNKTRKIWNDLGFITEEFYGPDDMSDNITHERVYIGCPEKDEIYFTFWNYFLNIPMYEDQKVIGTKNAGIVAKQCRDIFKEYLKLQKDTFCEWLNTSKYSNAFKALNSGGSFTGTPFKTICYFFDNIKSKLPDTTFDYFLSNEVNMRKWIDVSSNMTFNEFMSSLNDGFEVSLNKRVFKAKVKKDIPYEDVVKVIFDNNSVSTKLVSKKAQTSPKLTPQKSVDLNVNLSSENSRFKKPTVDSIEVDGENRFMARQNNKLLLSGRIDVPKGKALYFSQEKDSIKKKNQWYIGPFADKNTAKIIQGRISKSFAKGCSAPSEYIKDENHEKVYELNFPLDNSETQDKIIQIIRLVAKEYGFDAEHMHVPSFRNGNVPKESSSKKTVCVQESDSESDDETPITSRNCNLSVFENKHADLIAIQSKSQ